MPKKAPAYRQRKGYDQALVTLSDSVTKERRDYWLGTYGTPESRELYHRLIAEWEKRGRRLPDIETADPTTTASPRSRGITVAEIIHEYRPWAEQYYCYAHWKNLRICLRLLRQLYGSTPAADFGPKRLRLLREEMIRGDDDVDPPRRPWSRPYINAQVKRLVAMFKWAASHEMIGADVHQQLKTVAPLKRGRTDAHEPDPVKPVSDDLVDPIKPYVSDQVWALIELQRATGARPSELFGMRLIDLKMDEHSKVWIYTPESHKTAYLGKSRQIYIGPRGQKVIQPFVEGRAVDQPLFSPAEADAARRERQRQQRKTPLSCGNKAGTNRREAPQRKPTDRYDIASYRRAIVRACDQAFPPPAKLRRERVKAKRGTRWETDAEWRRRLGEKRWQELLAWRAAHRWHPYQLRHAAGTRIRREFGLEAAQIALGHSSALITDAVYAERDLTKVVKVMQKIG